MTSIAAGSRPGGPLARVREVLLHPAMLRAGIIVGFGLLWEILASVGIVTYASKPSEILAAVPGLFVNAEVQDAVSVTVFAISLSFLIGGSIGLILGMVLGLSSLLGAAYTPLLVIALGVPKSVFVPLFILSFGLGVEPQIIFGALLSAIVVAVNVLGGIETVEPRMYRVARSYGASPWRLFWHVVLPGGSPGIFAGLWHGIRNAFIGVVIVQLFVSDIGVGYLVRIYTNNFRVPEALAVVLTVAVVIIVIGVGWTAMERRLTRWNQPRPTS